MVDTPEDEVVTMPSQATEPMLAIRRSPMMSPAFQVLALPVLLVRLITLAVGLESAPIAARSWTPPLIVLTEDVFSLLSCNVYDHHLVGSSSC